MERKRITPFELLFLLISKITHAFIHTVSIWKIAVSVFACLISNGLQLYVWVCVFDLQMNSFNMWWFNFMNSADFENFNIGTLIREIDQRYSWSQFSVVEQHYDYHLQKSIAFEWIDCIWHRKIVYTLSETAYGSGDYDDGSGGDGTYELILHTFCTLKRRWIEHSN